MIYICFILMAVTSCLSREFGEQNSFASIDTKILTVPSDDVSGKVCDTLYITSNRSWSASFVQEVQWVRMVVSGNENIAGVSKITQIPLEFDFNESDEDRSVELVVNYDLKKETVTIIQEAKSNRLSLTDIPAGLESISSEGGRFDISFYCNTEWKAKVDYTDGMLVNLSSDKGVKSSRISVTVSENDDPENEKKAVITLSAEGCQDIDIVLIQHKWTPDMENGSESSSVF